MSALAVTRSDRFAAAVPMAVVSNWLSFHLTMNIGRFDELFLDDDPYRPGSAYFERSPIAHAPGSRTPTLILHGELDLCTPVGQARELYQALVDAGGRDGVRDLPTRGARVRRASAPDRRLGADARLVRPPPRTRALSTRNEAGRPLSGPAGRRTSF